MWKQGFDLPKEVYMQTLWFIRDYPRMKEEYESLMGRAHPMDGQPRGTDVGDPTGQTAVKCAELSDKIKAIELALGIIPEEYRQHIFESVVYRTPYPAFAALNTWKNYRRRFIYFVAKIMEFY